MIPKDSGRKENWYIRFITLCMSNFNIPEIIQQRHRHRYEFNNKYRKILEEHGLTISGVNPERNLVEIIELKNHPYFIASQFHPEFKSRPNRSEPLFQGFITAASDRKYKK